NWIPRARTFLEHGRSRALPPVGRTAPATRGDPRALARLLDEFSVLRGENLSTVASWALSRDDLEREGEHPEFGRVTLGQLLATWVAHDLSHLAQIARVMAKQHREAVGPWRAYLPIMDR
ncbi:DinB family protein, partial [Longimicrobium sp.]|uniref:DinB family protein n=1 Tax=Longimicrobium sp. TaxID=2029185 RepID=UPI002F95B39D